MTMPQPSRYVKHLQDQMAEVLQRLKDAEDRCETLAQGLEAAKDRNEELAEGLQAAEARCEDLAQELKVANARNEALAQRLENTAARSEDAATFNNELVQRLEVAEKAVETLQTTVNERRGNIADSAGDQPIPSAARSPERRRRNIADSAGDQPISSAARSPERRRRTVPATSSGTEFMEQHERAKDVLAQVAELAEKNSTKSIKKLLQSAKGLDALACPLVEHAIVYAPKPRWCAVCFRMVTARDADGNPTKRRTTTGGRIKTRCSACKLHFCVKKGCWKKWHHQHEHEDV